MIHRTHCGTLMRESDCSCLIFLTQKILPLVIATLVQHFDIVKDNLICSCTCALNNWTHHPLDPAPALSTHTYWSYSLILPLKSKSADLIHKISTH